MNELPMQDLIERALREGLDIHHLEIVNESNLHKGHAGDDGSGQTHFKLIVVSSDFDGCNRIQRQQKVNGLLKGAFDAGLHAISMGCMTLREFK